MDKPQVLFQSRCKICQMSNSAPELFRDLHAQILESGSSMNRAMNYINSRIDNEQIQVPKLNNQNMGAHFSSHITIPDRVNTELAKISTPGVLPPALSSINPTIGYEIEDMVRRRVGNDVNDYLNLDQLRSQMMEKLEILDAITSKTVSGETVVDFDAMAQYVSLIKEIRACIIDLNKIRSSKQLMSMVIKSLVEKQTFQTVKELSREYDQTKQDLLDAGVSESVAIKIDQSQRMRLAQIVATVARGVIEDVSRSYKLN
jgi:hypothetical protein